MAINWLEKIKGLLDPGQDTEALLASTALSAVVGNNRLAAFNTAAQTAVRAAVTEIDNGIDHLRSALITWENGNPVIQQATLLGSWLLKAEGIDVPSDDVIAIHLKAAVADVAGALGVSIAPAANTTSGTAPTPVIDPLAGAPVGSLGTVPAAIPDPAVVAAGGVPAAAAVVGAPVVTGAPTATAS